MNHSLAVGLVMAIALTLPAASASAGPCTTQIAEFEQSLQSRPDLVGTAPESLTALLRHQPTPASVESAKHDARAEVNSVLAEAKAFDAQGKRDECADALDRARLLVNP
jgi:hypothetical protein